MTKLVKTRMWDGTERYKNTSLRCKDPLYRNSCSHAGKIGTCALVRKLTNGATSVVPPESIDPTRDICFISPPYTPVEGVIDTVSQGSMGETLQRFTTSGTISSNTSLINKFINNHKITKK